jgi:3-oxoacyl-[acyl-carrier-protein] synthase-3
MTKIRAAITAVNGYVPDYILTNKELEKLVDTTEDWILTRTGIEERRILKGEGKATSDMCVEAINKLLEKRGISALEIDMVIVGTVTPDMVFPSTANVICDKIGATNAWGYDVSAACSGFIYSLVTASKFIETGTHKKILVVGADKMSSIIDYQDRSTCIIFGDGAGVVLLEPSTDENGIVDSILRSDGSGRNYLHQKAGGSLKPASHQTVDAREHAVFQEGKTVYKFAVKNMADVSAEIMERNNLTSDDVAWLVAHQANKRIIDATASRMGLGPEKVMLNIQRYGNTTAGTIPLCLWDYEKQLKKGDNLIISAFGGGFTWGAIYLKWGYNS